KVIRISRSHQPWFDHDCRSAKRMMRNSYRKFKREGPNSKWLALYLEFKKVYRKLLVDKKTKYFENLSQQFKNTRNSKEFWNTVKQFRKKKAKVCKLDVGTVEEFYSQLYTRASGEATPAMPPCYGTYDEHFDREITLTELETALKSFKDNKAAGVDGVAYEFYKNLPINWMQFVLSFFNSLLRKVSVPACLAEIRTFLLFKKGEEDDPKNYRGISLINSLLKIFNQILLNRLDSFVAANNLLPESQNGFRKGRGCQDNIFILSSLVAINTRLPKSKTFVAFIDFQRAFDSLNHEILWRKLALMNVSARFISLLSSLYSNASFRVKVNDSETQSYRVGAGILQGDVTSPLIFALFLADLSNFLVKRGLRGLDVGDGTDVLSLCYADDLCLLTYSYREMKNILNALADYCVVNDLQINHDKSAVMVFQQKGSIPRYYEFRCGQKEIKIAKSYMYLGVNFSSSGLFNKQSSYSVSKGETATRSLLSLLYKLKGSPISSWLSAMGATVLSTTLYAAEVWGLNHADVLDKAQVRAAKSALFIASSTPDHYVRSELGLKHVKIQLFKLALNWYLKLGRMEGQRLPKKCLHRLRELGTVIDARYSWWAQLATYFSIIGEEELWYSQNVDAIGRKRNDLIEKMTAWCTEQDAHLIANSTFNEIFKFCSTEPGISTYLETNLGIACKRLLAQVRLAGKHYAKLTLPKLCVRLKSVEQCPCCNWGVPDTTEHFVGNCPVFRGERMAFFGSDTISRETVINCLTSESKEVLRRMFYFLQNIMKIRIFFLNEGFLY
ncbi:unnamed protein product, partial [Nesidiocoris tenuis]